MRALMKEMILFFGERVSCSKNSSVDELMSISFRSGGRWGMIVAGLKGEED